PLLALSTICSILTSFRPSVKSPCPCRPWLPCLSCAFHCGQPSPVTPSSSRLFTARCLQDTGATRRPEAANEALLSLLENTLYRRGIVKSGLPVGALCLLFDSAGHGSRQRGWVQDRVQSSQHIAKRVIVEHRRRPLRRQLAV